PACPCLGPDGLRGRDDHVAACLAQPGRVGQEIAVEGIRERLSDATQVEEIARAAFFRQAGHVWLVPVGEQLEYSTSRNVRGRQQPEPSRLAAVFLRGKQDHDADVRRTPE